jgi:hypothetical protein
LRITDSETGIREINLASGETLTQATIVNAMFVQDRRSRKRIERFIAEMFDSLEAHALEQRQLAASTAP